MKSDIAARKLSEAKKQLAQNQKEQSQSHTFAHRLDTHDLKNKGEGAGIRVVGGDEHKSSHGTLYQAKMRRNETATNAGVPKPRTTLQRQQAASGYPLFD
jgi:hypothetical protein